MGTPYRKRSAPASNSNCRATSGCRQPLHDPRLKIGKAIGQADHDAALLRHGAYVFHQLLELVDPRPAKVVALAPRAGVAHRGEHRARDVADIHRLEQRLGTSTASTGRKRASLANWLRNRSSGPNTTEGRNTVASRSEASTACSPMPLERRYSEGADGAAPSA